MCAFLRGASLSLALLVCSQPARGAEPCALADGSALAIAACAVATHPLVLVERERLAGLGAARDAASVLLPSHPELSIAFAERSSWQSGPGRPTPALNFYLTLSQKLEIAGQRSARVAVVAAQTRAQLQRLALIELSLAADAAEAALVLAALKERSSFAGIVRGLAQRLTAVAEVRLQESLLSELEASLLMAEASRIAFDADELLLALLGAEARLRSFVATAPTGAALPEIPATLPGDLETWADRASSARAELAALRAEADAQLASATQLERERVPSPTLSGFVQSDGFGERVLGGGLSIPLFLPSPLGPSRRGEIDAARAKARELDAEHSARQRQVRYEVETAVAVLRARERQAAQSGRAGVERARAQVRALTEALGSNKLALREGLSSLRALIDLVDRGTTTRLSVFVARLALARAVALPLEEVLP